MLRDGIHGFCMALADSVPGVSGGTVAFIMGFYDRFIGAIDTQTSGNRSQKKQALCYLVKLGCGWIIGMGLAVLLLSALFESHIYIVSSLFLGFIAGAIPLIIREEKDCLKQSRMGLFCFLIGAVLVAGITWANGQVGTAALDLAHFSIGTSVRLFLIGMIAISAMFNFLWMWNTDRGSDSGKDHSYQPGAVSQPDSIFYSWHDGGFFLCNHYRAYHIKDSTGGTGIWNISYSGGTDCHCTGDRNADGKRRKVTHKTTF